MSASPINENAACGCTTQPDPVACLMAIARKRDPGQVEFLQALEEVLQTLAPVFERDPKYISVMSALMEPERIIQFRVRWIDEAGREQVNRGYRVQYNSAIGPYKGGLRFHPSVNLSILKFLGFEQIFKNSLTTLPMGGAKGGSDFNPRDRSDRDVMAFCQAFMSELFRHIGPHTDVPAGDIGVGGREVGYLQAQYKKLTNSFVGVLTGKHPNWGGSLIRPEATGYGAVYFANEMLVDHDKSLKSMRCVVSGAGNVAQYTVEKLLDFGAIPLTVSDSDGYILEEDGFTREKLAQLMELKNKKRGRLSEFPSLSSTAKYFADSKPWDVPCDIAFPCATQNEIREESARLLVKTCFAVVECANMPCTPEAIAVFHENKIMFAPAKAANAGGVAVSGLEMSQNSMRLAWDREEVDEKLKLIMAKIYKECRDAAESYGVPGNLQTGANIAGFLKVANSMIDQGCV